jgi:hypothetical protein
MKKRTLNLAIVSLILCLLVQTGQAQVGRGKFGFGLSAGPALLQSDLKTNDVGYGASADMSYSLGHGWGLMSSLGFDSYSGTDNTNQTIYSDVLRADLAVTFDFLPRKPFNPFLYAGGGAMFAFPRIASGTSLTAVKRQLWDSYAVGGLGIDYFINESWSIIVTAGGAYTSTDLIDGKLGGGRNDTFARCSIGVRYYLFDRSTVEKLVEEVRK